jgi:hypothetical protein
VTSTVACHCYRMVTVATDEDVMSPKTVATEGHSSDGRFGDITKAATVETSHKMRVATPSVDTEAFCSSEG